VAELDSYLAYLVLAGVLTDGDGSRLQQRLVHRDPIVTDISAGCGLFGPLEARDPDTFTVTAIHAPDVPVERVIAAIDEELQLLAEQPPTKEELAKVTARWSATMHREHDRLTTRTLGLGSAELLFGRAELIHELPERIAAVTVDEVAAAAKALRPDSRAVLIINPASAGGNE